MKKTLAILLSLVLTLTLFAACNKDKDSGETTTTAGDTTTADNGTTAPGGSGDSTNGTGDTTTIGTEDTTGVGDTTTTGTDDTTAAGDTTTTKLGETTTQNSGNNGPVAPQGTAAILDAYAAAVNKTLAANKQVSKECKIVINRPMQGDEKILNLLKKSVASFNVENTVCGLLGEGQGVYNQSMKEALQPSTLRMDDVTGATASMDANGNVSLVINVKDCVNPQKLAEGGSPMGRFTWDFTSLKTVDDGIATAEKDIPTLKINIDKKTLSYTNVKITATISADGVLTKLVHSYNYTARVEGVAVKAFGLTVGSGEWGQGTATGTMTYTF